LDCVAIGFAFLKFGVFSFFNLVFDEVDSESFWVCFEPLDFSDLQLCILYEFG
jgi:hypothetical protein